MEHQEIPQNWILGELQVTESKVSLIQILFFTDVPFLCVFLEAELLFFISSVNMSGKRMS